MEKVPGISEKSGFGGFSRLCKSKFVGFSVVTFSGSHAQIFLYWPYCPYAENPSDRFFRDTLEKKDHGTILLKCDFHDLQGIVIIRQVFERFSIHRERHGFHHTGSSFSKIQQRRKTWLVEFFPLHWLQL